MNQFIPPGYITLKDLVSERGEDEVRKRLWTGEITARTLSRSDGHLGTISSKDWGSGMADHWLRSGTTYHRISAYCETILVEVPVKTDQQVIEQSVDITPGPYRSPFIDMMLEASAVFKLGEKSVKKAELIEWFLAQRLPDGAPITRNLAEAMATLCRPPEAMAGGNKRVG